MAANKSFKDPVTTTERHVAFGKDARTISDSVIGFINRDEQITKKLPTPMCVNSLGANFMRDVRNKLNIGSWFNKPWYSHVVNATRTDRETVPGFMTLFFEPVFADADEDGFSYTHQSYLSKWMSARNLDNMTKNWQPGDMQFVDAALGIIKMQLAVATRALLILRDVAQKSENRYYNKVGMLRAMGFHFTEKGADIYYDDLWSYFNKAIISFLNSNAWLRYSYPGINRWAALCEALYRDTPAKTNYAQMYLFMPQRHYSLGEEYDGSTKIGWTITPDDEDWNTRYSASSISDADARGYNGFMRFLDDIHQNITFLFYNDDVKDIIATLNAIAARNLGNELSDSARFNFQRIGFEPESNEMEAPIIYDSAMLIAIHNATIASCIKPSVARITPSSGLMNQTLSVEYEDFSSAAGFGPMGSSQISCAALLHPKVLNFPNFNPTQCDLINATQWTISLSNSSPENEHYTDDTVPAWTVGSDYISGCRVTWLADSAAPYQAVSYGQSVYTGTLVSPRSYPTAGSYNSMWTMANDLVAIGFQSMFEYEQAQQFAFAPICNRYCDAAVDDYNSNQAFAYMGPLVQSEVYWIIDGGELSKFHDQWKANFWGFPIYNTGGAGSVNLTVSGTSSINTDGAVFGNDPLTAT